MGRSAWGSGKGYGGGQAPGPERYRLQRFSFALIGHEVHHGRTGQGGDREEAEVDGGGGFLPGCSDERSAIAGRGADGK